VDRLNHVDNKTKGRLKATLNHSLGMVAQEQRQWEQAEQYYQQALQICVEYNDRYSQASTYHQLGSVAQEQRQWNQAGDYLLQALDIFVTFEETNSIRVTLRSLATLWQASVDASLLNTVAEKLGVTGSEVEKLLHEILGDSNGTERE
jgi:tetratricopeptide (TPR) repeat protein